MEIGSSASPAVTYATRGILQLAEHGRTGPGGRLPSERRLAEELQISRTTLRAALQQLEDAGLIEGKPQSGWYVTTPHTVADRSSELESFTEIARQQGFTPSAKVLRQDVRVITLAEAQRLEVPPATAVLDIQRVRFLDDVPICIDSAILPAKLCEPLVDEDFGTASLFERLEVACGIVIDRTACELRAHPADADAARLLALNAGDAMLQVDSTGYTADGAPVLISVLDYRGDSYHFKAELVRPSIRATYGRLSSS